MNSFFILSIHSHEVIIEKHWRSVSSRELVDIFWENLAAAETPQDTPPIIEIPVAGSGAGALVHILRDGLCFLCVVKAEISPLFVIEFLNRIYDVFKEYFNSVDEASLKENFSTVYQVLEEMCDYGSPVITEPNSLMDMVKPPTITAKLAKVVAGRSTVSDELPGSTVSNVPWRRKQVQYTQNEIYFDIVEYLNCLIDRNGKTIYIDVSGEINCICKLSGVPDVTILFHDPSPIGDYSLHPCVRYNRYSQEKVLSFIPPDGKLSEVFSVVEGISKELSQL